MSAGPLESVPFTPELLQRESVQAFDCGTEPWELAITTWLKAPPGKGGASDDVVKTGNHVWLYVTPTRDLVGVGSIGPATASWPKNSSPRAPATCITQIAVDRRHRGKGYGAAIFEALLSVARASAAERSICVLYVDAENPAAGWYREKYNFTVIGNPYPEPVSGRPHLRMALKLTV